MTQLFDIVIIFRKHKHQVLTRENEEDRPIEGFWAAGETACASVHGANRLGANSLLEIVVFGKAIADQIDCLSRPGERHEDLSPVRDYTRDAVNFEISE